MSFVRIRTVLVGGIVLSSSLAGAAPSVAVSGDPVAEELDSREVAESKAELSVEKPPGLDEQEPKVNAQQMRAESALIIQQIEEASTDLKEKLSTAREATDVVKTLCLDDKGRQVETAFGAAKDRRVMLVGAISSGALDRARHQFTLIGVLGERVVILRTEAGQCIGEEASFTEDAASGDLSMVVDSILPGVDSNSINLAPVITLTASVSSAVN